MIGVEDSPYTYEYDEFYKILPTINNWSSDPKRINSGVKVPDGFQYTSDSNSEWMSIDELQEWISINTNRIGRI